MALWFATLPIILESCSLFCPLLMQPNAHFSIVYCNCVKCGGNMDTITSPGPAHNNTLYLLGHCIMPGRGVEELQSTVGPTTDTMA